MNSYDLCKSLAFSSLYNENKTRSTDIHLKQSRQKCLDLSLVHWLTYTTHNSLLSRYVLCTIYFFAENCWFHIGQSQKFKIMFWSSPLSYHNSMVATVSPGWLCKHTISATIYIRFLEPQQERSSSRAMSECNVSIMFLTTLMYSYFCDHNVFNLWLPAVGLQILCK